MDDEDIRHWQNLVVKHKRYLHILEEKVARFGKLNTPAHILKGQLDRKHVIAGEIHIIGKESNKVQRVASGEIQRIEEVQTEYKKPRRCARCGKEIEHLKSNANVCSARCQKKDSASYCKLIKRGKVIPHVSHWSVLRSLITQEI
jgi:hypothetical protein